MRPIGDRKQSVYIPADMGAELESEMQRLDRSKSWLIQRAWKLAKSQIMAMPGANELDKEAA